MNDTTEALPGSSDELAIFKSYTPLAVLTDHKVYGEFYEKLRQTVDAHTPDVSTDKGRKEIASLAYKVARTKTAIDDAGKKLNEDARAQINAIDESRREIRRQLDELKDEVRKPLTEWEEAEAAREAEAKAELDSIRNMAIVEFAETAEDVQERINALTAITIVEAVHREMAGVAEAARTDAIAALTAAHERLIREEQERAELERLRAEAAERERLEAEKAAEAEATRLREEAEKAEAERKEAAEKAEQERLEQAQREAEERAKAEAERKAQEEREATERAHAEALAVERQRAEEAERAAQAERDRAAADEAARKEAAEREAAAQKAREADRAYRGEVMGAAKEAIMEAGPCDENVAKAIVLAIAAGSVPHVSIRF